MVTGPLTDTLSGRLSVLYREIDGWVENTALNDRDETQEEEQVVRLGLHWQPTDALGIQFKYENAQFDTVGRNIELVGDVIREDLPPGTGTSYLTALPRFVANLNSLIDAGVRTGPKITSFVPDDGEYNDKRTAGAWDTSENDVDNFLFDANYEWCDHTLSFVTGYVEYDTSETYDVDNDGDEDLLVGNYLDQLTKPGADSYAQWQKEGRDCWFLENKTRSKR